MMKRGRGYCGSSFSFHGSPKQPCSCETEQRNDNEKHVEAASKTRMGRKGECELKLLHSSIIINASLRSCRDSWIFVEILIM